MLQLFEYIKGIFAFDPNSPLLFTHFQFWAFFAIVFALFSLLQSKTLLRNAYLFFVSLLFYYKTSGLFVGLLLLVTVSDFFIAQGIYHFRDRSLVMKRLLLCLSVIIDLGILCYFKYAYFFADVVNQLFGTSFEVTNIAAEWANGIVGSNFFSVDRIILPVGISFYTFQVISYTADVYKGLVKPVRNILDFGFYVSFFPQLVAGPIVKASDFIPQLYRRYSLSRMQFGIAVFWILNGLAKKIILSDYLAVNFIDRVFNNPQFFGGFENLSALFLYSLQVYADFSGYTDIAIGLSLLMGFHLPLNFNSPYKAQNAGNFWKRWHISLSRWLQTYLYIPLGGNRNISFGTYFWISTITLIALILSGNIYVAFTVLALAIAVIFTAWRYPEKRKHIYANLNSMITMLLGGLWHGASMNFMIWGGLNGVGMVIFKFWRDMSLLCRALVPTLLSFGLYALKVYAFLPLWNLLLVFMIFIAASAWIRYVYNILGCKNPLTWLNRGWSILVTFTFITFTRLFFRSGSNLDPAIANETAWGIAKDMINSIGTQWNVNVLDVISAYRSVFILFVLGMIVHWLPTRFKRRYRICFAKMPLPLMAIVTVIIIFVCYQFVTAEMQPFIYFQF
ncbi:MAG: MBOAT family O-acyltransferase [Bacteroidales bacterium]|nr:MBOAT family O-acyltransferase [Bacteroidales bacterium]